MTASAIFSRVIAYGSFVLMARSFSQEEIGVWAVLMTMYLFAEVTVNLGLDKLITRNIVQSDEKTGSENLCSALIIKLVIALPGLIVCLLLVRWLYPAIWSDYSAAIIFFFLVLPCIGPCRAFEAWHTAKGHMYIPAIAQFAERAVFLILAAAAFANLLSFPLIIAGNVLPALIRFLINLKPALPQVIWAIPKHPFALVTESIRLFAVELLAGIYFRVDVLLISSMADLSQTGIYHAAYRIFEVSTVVFAGYLTASFPELARKNNSLTLGKLYLLGLALVLPATIGGVIFARYILLLFGDEYVSGSTALMLLMLTLPFSYTTTLMANNLVVLGRLNVLLVMAVIMVALNLALNIYAIPIWGIEGAAAVTLIGELTGTVFLAFLTCRYQHRPAGRKAMEEA